MINRAPISIIYQDDFILVVDKPAGIVVNRAESVKGQTLEDWAQEYLGNANFQDQESDFGSRKGIVHRLDKDTSGIIIIAKNEDSFKQLQSQFKNRTVKKTYIALVHNRVTPGQGSIEAPIARQPWNRLRFGIVPSGKPAKTNYKLLAYYQKREKGKIEEFSLVEIYPLTGRTHQIRVHFKYINYPLVGDSAYAGRKTSRADLIWAPRILLHAQKLKLNHPDNSKELEFISKIPSDFEEALNKLNKLDF